MELNDTFVLKRMEAIELFNKYTAPKLLQDAFIQLLNDNIIMDWPLRVSDHSMEAHLFHLNLLKKMQQVQWHNGSAANSPAGKLRLNIPESKLLQINMPDDCVSMIVNAHNMGREDLKPELALLRFINKIADYTSYEHLYVPERITNQLDKIKIKNNIFDIAFNDSLNGEIVGIDAFVNSVKKWEDIYSNILNK